MAVVVQSGEVLAGKYRVERVLGEGGMGVVVAARHLQLDQMVALKFLLPEAVSNEEALSRFMREARNAVRLKSEHVARILDVGVLDHGAPYIVMEFLQGSDLAGVLAQRGTMPIPMAVDYLLQACDAIAEAHALGIIHRDLKPQNLFVTRAHDGTSLVKVLDFGISKSLSGDDFKETRPQDVMGTPAYMSPEQMRSSKFVDGRTDVWALGVILYELVVGRVPWEAETFTELCFKVAMDPLPPLPAALQRGGFDGVVRRCLEKDPARRLPDVAALAAALAPFAPEHAQPLVERIRRVQRGSGGSQAEVLPDATAVPVTLREAVGQQVTHKTRRAPKRGLAALAATVVLAGVATSVVALRGGPSEESGARPASSPARAPMTDRATATPRPAPPPPPSVAAPAPAAATLREPAPGLTPKPDPEAAPPAAPKKSSGESGLVKATQDKAPVQREPAPGAATLATPPGKQPVRPSPPSGPSGTKPAGKPSARPANKRDAEPDPLASPD